MSNQVPFSAESTLSRRKSRTLISAVSRRMPLIASDQVSGISPVQQQLHRQSDASRLSPLVVVGQPSQAFSTAFQPAITSESSDCIEATHRLVQHIKPGSTVLPQAIVPPMLTSCRSHQRRDAIPPLIDQLTHQISNFYVGSGPSRFNQCSGLGYFGGAGHAPREIRFDPPWMHRIGQLQNVAEVLRKYSSVHLKNKNSLIIRCFAQSSAVYMELVFSVIDTVFAELVPDNPQLEVEPILLSQNAVKCLQSLQIQKYKTEKEQWTDTVLLRIPLKTAYNARLFQVKFNRLVLEVFDKMSVRTPFAHPDCTRPERDLRLRLQTFCREKNIASRALQMAAKRDGFEWTGAEKYFHNGVQLFKKSHIRMTAMKLQPDSEIQHFHSVIATLKKYSQLYEEKKLSAIIQNFPRPPLITKEVDMEHLRAAVNRVVLTHEFRERCSGSQNFEIHRVMRNPEASLNCNQERWHQIQRPQSPLVRVRFRSAKAAVSFIQLFEECNAPFFKTMTNMQFGKKNERRNQPFAHKDLTPPELALEYALKQYCKERNKRGTATNNYVYIRNSKVFEKSRIV